MFKRYEEFEDKKTKFESRRSKPGEELVKHEEDLLLKSLQSDKDSEMERLRRKRLRREEKERKRVE